MFWKKEKIAEIDKRLEELGKVTNALNTANAIRDRQTAAELNAVREEFKQGIESLRGDIEGLPKTDIELLKEDFNILMKKWSIGFERKVNDRMDILEGTVDEKIVGLYKRVEERLANNNGNNRTIAGFLRRIAILENLKDKQEHRRSVQELLDMKERLHQEALKLDREEKNYFMALEKIELLKWVLGEKDEG